MSKAQPVPAGFHSLTPHLTVKNAAKAIDWYKSAFGAVEVDRSLTPGGDTIMHATLRIGDSHLMLNDEFPPMALAPSAEHHGVSLHLYVGDVDAVFSRAINSGAKTVMPVMDMFWGDRYGVLTDPYGHHWSVGTHKEDLAPAEIEKRAVEFFARHKK